MAVFDPRALGARPTGLRRERIVASPRYRGGRFHNTEPLSSTLSEAKTLGQRLGIMSEFVFGGERRVPREELPVESPLRAWSRAPETGLRATWLGHSTDDLVMLEVGAYHRAWGQIHLGPDNALIAHRMLGGGALLPVHWGTFDLGLHPWDEPIETLAKSAGAAGVQLLTPRLGRAIEPSRAGALDPWWRQLGSTGRASGVHAAVPSSVPAFRRYDGRVASADSRVRSDDSAHRRVDPS